MKRRRNIRSKVIMGLIAMAALVVSMLLVQAQAADTDLDGINDDEEMINFHFCKDSNLTYPVCTQGSNSTCLDKATKDLFYVLMPDPNNPSTTLIPADLDVMEFISKAAATRTSGGLAITTHKIDSTKIGCTLSDTVTYCDRCVISRPNMSYQFAMRITESLDVSDPNTLGQGTRGLVGDDATTYTQRIWNNIDSICKINTTYACVDADGVTKGIDGLFKKWLKHDVAHETGHALKLTKDSNSSYGGYHYAPGSDLVMEQQVTYKVNDSKKTITFYYISDKFSDADRTNMSLK